MSDIVATDRLAKLELYGRRYGELRFAVGWTDGLDGDAAKVARNWQKNPDRLADASHGAGVFHRGLTRNPVVALRASRLIGVDVDGEAGRALVRKLLPQRLPRTVTVVSGREDGGHHFWYRPPAADWPNAKIEFGKAGLTLSADGYFVLPPAIHGETRRPYQFAKERAPWQIEIATLPVEILTTLAAHNQQVDASERADDNAPVPTGRRHLHLRRLACAMRRVGAGEATITAALIVENMKRCQPPEEEQVVRDLAKDVVKRYEPGVRAA